MRIWILGARPRTLPAAVVPVVVGVAAVAGASIIWWKAALALVVSLALQVGVNYANDYSDGVRGTDAVRVGPLRLVASGAASPAAVKRAALVAFAVAALSGLVLAATTGWWLILVGLAAIAAAWGYTGGPRPYGYMGLGEVFVFVFFGLVATVGSGYVATQTLTVAAVLAGVGVGVLACALLEVNNLRDLPQDAAVGKRTLAVRLGDGSTRRLHGALILAAFAVVGVLAVVVEWPVLLALLALPAAWAAWRPVAGGAQGADLIPVLGAVGRLHLVYGVLLALGLALSA